MDKLKIEVYEKGSNYSRFLGYIKSVSLTKNVFTCATDKKDAKVYSKQETAAKDINKLMQICTNINNFNYNFQIVV